MSILTDLRDLADLSKLSGGVCPVYSFANIFVSMSFFMLAHVFDQI